ncbi:MAG: Ig-like domain-containing protein [Deinococcota bacterium]
MRHRVVDVAVLLALLLIACSSDPIKEPVIEEPGAEVEGIFVEPTRLELAIGENTTLQARVTGFGDRNVLYNSSNLNIATVDAMGLVTALHPGRVVITATSEAESSLFATSLVTVTGTSRLPTITSFSASPEVIQPGEMATLSWEVLGEDVEVSLQPDVGELGDATSVEVRPLETTAYTLIASNTAGSDQASVMITVVGGVEDICAGDYTVGSRAELIALETCRAITGTLTIDGLNDVPNLTALASLEQVTHLAILSNASLESLEGLENITTIPGNLTIGGGGGGIIELSVPELQQTQTFGNDLLTSLEGLDNLLTIGGKLSIGLNDNLTSLSGLDNLTTVGGNVFIFDNDALQFMDGLGRLTSIGGSFAIYDHRNLEYIIRLGRLRLVGGNVNIFRNDALVSLDGFGGLSLIGSDLSINFNFSLTSLAAIASLTNDDIGGEARIFDNDNLDCSSQNLQFTVVGTCN